MTLDANLICGERDLDALALEFISVAVGELGFDLSLILDLELDLDLDLDLDELGLSKTSSMDLCGVATCLGGAPPVMTLFSSSKPDSIECALFSSTSPFSILSVMLSISNENFNEDSKIIFSFFKCLCPGGIDES